MKLKLLLMTSLFALNLSVVAQSNKDIKEIKYRRSSLHTILMESATFPKKDLVLKAYNNADFPDKYDNHNIGDKSFDLKKYTTDTDESKAPEAIAKYLKENQIAKKLVSKWYNRKADGSFDGDLIATRGLFNASFLDGEKAGNLGKGILMNAGKELLNNTFVIVNNMKFIENEPVARVARDIALTQAAKIGMEMLRNKAIETANKGYEVAKEGYSVWTTSYLFKLKWEPATLAVFNSDMYFEKEEVSQAKKVAFDKSEIFEMEFVGTEKATTLVTFSLNGKRTEEEVINLSVNRNLDKVYAKLQKNYDVFKTKVPLFSGQPITAKIGTKEGLEGDEKFEVLEVIDNEETGETTYKSVGTIKVDKDQIWDNQYNLINGKPAAMETDPSKPALESTMFKGGKKFGTGMLIRQLK
jgi:hypothetical protein